MISLMFQPRFAAPILAGTKCQTIRPPRKRPIVVGQWLSLRRWEGKAYRSEQIEIAAVRCSGVFEITVSHDTIAIGGIASARLTVLNTFAHGDGFESWGAMKKYYELPGGYGLPFSGVLIQWEVPLA